MINADFIEFLKDRPADEKYMAFIFREKSSQEIVDRIPIELSIDDVEVEGNNVVSVARFTHNPSIVTFKEDTMSCDDHISPIDDDESSDEDSIFQSTDDDEEYLLKRRDELKVNDYELESDEYGASDYDRFYEEFNYDDTSSMYVQFSDDDNSMYVNFSDDE